MKTVSMEKFKDYFLNLMKDRKRLIKILIIILILLLAVVMRISENNKSRIVVSKSAQNEIEESYIYIDVGGAVVNPGVYKLKKGSRVYEVIRKAGGLSENADTSSLNQAKFLEDGEKINVPISIKNNDISEDSNSNLININTADKSKLMELNGIGNAIAERIIDYRNTTYFKSIEEIKNVKGIGEATFEKIKSQITI